MVTGSGFGFGASRLTQNLGSGQRVDDHPTILGPGQSPRDHGKDVG